MYVQLISSWLSHAIRPEVNGFFVSPVYVDYSTRIIDVEAAVRVTPSSSDERGDAKKRNANVCASSSSRSGTEIVRAEAPNI